MRKSSRRKKIGSGGEEIEAIDENNTVIKVVETPRKIYPTSVVSINWDAIHTKRKLDNDERAALADLYYDVQKPSKSVIAEVKTWIEKYSDIQIYQNFLETCYRLEDEVELANEVSLALIKKFPESVFAKISQIEIYLSKLEYDKITEFLNGKLTMKELYPEKGNFHIQEMISYHFAMGKYFSYSGLKENAEESLKQLKALDEEHIYNKKLLKVLDKNSGLKFYQKVLKKLK